MLLLYLTGKARRGCYKLIYIPLCFYFIGKRPSSATGLPNLHSTMLLLYRLFLRLSVSGISIYIPLCFYFIDVHTDRALSHYIIYIPLCFYFIRACRISCYLYRENLHSTMLLLYQNANAKYKGFSAFTFHYASTLSAGTTWHGQHKTHLHSTMLLLYPKSSCVAMRGYLYLHSTMLLLYQTDAEGVFQVVYSFTFHYASTLSAPGDLSDDRRIEFTFHYASTLSSSDSFDISELR